MKTPRLQIAAALAQRSLSVKSESAFANEIAAYLMTERRTNDLDSLMRDVMQYRADHGIVEVSALSAHPVTTGVKADIEKQVKTLYPDAKQVLVNEVHDASVVGGVRLELANQQLDLSVRAKLNRFKQLTSQGKE